MAKQLSKEELEALSQPQPSGTMTMRVGLNQESLKEAMQQMRPLAGIAVTAHMAVKRMVESEAELAALVERLGEVEAGAKAAIERIGQLEALMARIGMVRVDEAEVSSEQTGPVQGEGGE